MRKTPIAALHTEGRTFGTDWSIANVAKLLRSNAARGSWRHPGASGGYKPKINQDYIRMVSARHLPTSVTLIFMRLEDDNCWYASLCFAEASGFLPWNEDTAEQWLWALFGQDRPKVLTVWEESGSESVRQFTLARTC
jgi:hypothetical protein